MRIRPKLPPLGIGFRTVQSVINSTPHPKMVPLEDPEYMRIDRPYHSKVGMAVESMRKHMTDEGWQIFAGLQHSGYTLAGHSLPFNSTDTRKILEDLDPSVVVLQDKREWDVPPGTFRDYYARFTNYTILKQRPDIFKVTILKDAHQRQYYHLTSAYEIGCHAWIIYYHPDIVRSLAPFVREEHLIRTYHSIDKNAIPPFQKSRSGSLLSGARSSVYPFREWLWYQSKSLPQVDLLGHPGYHARGCNTPHFLRTLNNYKVSICTCSIYGYALRKIIESTCCGCMVVTDLPAEDKLPVIDHNLIRVPPDIPIKDLANLLQELYNTYDPERQECLAREAVKFYDYRNLGAKLSQDIEEMRCEYS